MAKNEIQKRSPSELALPEYLAAANLPQGEGFEEMRSDDQLLPRLQIAQALSPQLNEDDPGHIAGLKQGQLFNSVSGNVYGTECQIIPLFFFHSAINIQDSKVQCMSKDAKVCPRYGLCKCDTWKEGETIQERKPECQKLLNYVSLVLGANDLVVVSLKSTGVKVAKKWNSLQKLLTTVSIQGRGMTRLPMYSRQYKVSTVSAKNAANQRFFQWMFQDSGWSPEEFVKQASPMIESLRGKVVVDAAGLASEREPGENDGEF